MDNSKTINKATQADLTPSQAIDILKSGNERFLGKGQFARDLNSQVSDTSTGQFPFAAVVGCIDSRVPAELVFDQGIGDIFNVRIAGNFVNEDILGSLEFSCKVAGAKAILVLGHTSCGAVKGACDDVHLGNLTAMLKNLKPAVELAAESMGHHGSDNADFVQKVVELNVDLTVNEIREKSEVLKEMEDNGEIKIVGAIYDVSTGVVHF